MAQENPMPIQDNINAPITLTFTRNNFLKSSTQKSLPRDKTQSCRIHEPIFCIPLLGPITGKNVTKINTKLQPVDGNLTLNFTPAAHRKAYLGKPDNLSNVRQTYPANSKDIQDG